MQIEKQRNEDYIYKESKIFQQEIEENNIKQNKNVNKKSKVLH